MSSRMKTFAMAGVNALAMAVSMHAAGRPLPSQKAAPPKIVFKEPRPLGKKFHKAPNYDKRIARIRHVARAKADPTRGLTNWQLLQYNADCAVARSKGYTPQTAGLWPDAREYRTLTKERLREGPVNSMWPIWRRKAEPELA